MNGNLKVLSSLKVSVGVLSLAFFSDLDIVKVTNKLFIVMKELEQCPKLKSWSGQEFKFIQFSLRATIAKEIYM